MERFGSSTAVDYMEAYYKASYSMFQTFSYADNSAMVLGGDEQIYRRRQRACH
jgi:hypothetical protein